jgi:hypothetical protein
VNSWNLFGGRVQNIRDALVSALVTGHPGSATDARP